MAVIKLIGYRTHVVVPNVSWGLGLNHECDMLVLDKHNRFTEIELKISAADLKKDFTKSHQHKSRYISRLVYALPEWLYESHGELIPAGCGVILVSDIGNTRKILHATWERNCKHSKHTLEIPRKILDKFYHLGCMRIWSLKQRITEIKADNERLRKTLTEGSVEMA